MQASTTCFRSTADNAGFYAVCGALAGIPIFVLVYAGIKGEMQLGGLLAGSFVTLGFLYFWVLVFIDTSELILEETGIRRKVLGRTCMRISWKEINVIRERFLVNRRYGGQICIEIIPTTPRDFALRLRRSIKFTEQVENFDQLIDKLNQRIKQYAIPIELNCNGMWKPESTLLASVTTQETRKQF